MMEKIFDDSDFTCQRFVCDCKSQEHSMDICVETPEGAESIVTVNMYLAGKPRIAHRLKQAWKSLCGKDGQLGDFCVRTEDVPHIIRILEVALPKEIEAIGGEIGMNRYPRFSANDTEQIYLTYATYEELYSAGYFPTMTAGSAEVIWRRY